MMINRTVISFAWTVSSDPPRKSDCDRIVVFWNVSGSHCNVHRGLAQRGMHEPERWHKSIVEFSVQSPMRNPQCQRYMFVNIVT
eukprot:4497192-Amphidinium_carterae.1